MVGELPPVVLRFLSYKETIQNCSPLTVAEYGNDLRTFFKYIVALVMLFSGSNLSYNEEVIGLTGHCLS